MLRTTFSRIRKVCSNTFIPRILRGDQCSAVSSAVIRRAYKSTKSTEDGGEVSTGKREELPQYTFSSAADLRIDEKFKKQIVEAAGVVEKTANDDNKTETLRVGLPLTHRERCQKIIDQAFGTSSDLNPKPDRMMSEQYFSRTVDLEDTRREIHESEKEKLKLEEQKILTDNTNSLLPDDRSQYRMFEMSRELNVDEDTQDEIIVTHSNLSREPDLSKNMEDIKGIAEETPLVEEPNLSEAKVDFDKGVNNPESIEKKVLWDDDAETIEVAKDEREPYRYQEESVNCQLHMPWFLNATTTRELNLTYIKEDVDKNVNNPENVEKEAPFDADTNNVVEDELKHDLHDEATPKDQSHPPQALNATTANQDEELLTQKIENIEETPLVEAQKPKLEGNATPRVLGNEPSLKFEVIEDAQDNSPTIHLPDALDEVSKRCLNCPLGQIDEMLIKEMEKLGMTYRTAQAPSTPIENEIVQMDEQDIYYESPELEKNENERATDTSIPNDETEQAEAEEAVKPSKEESHDIIYPSKSVKYNPANDYNSTTKFASYYSPPKDLAAELDKQEQEQATANRLFSKVPNTVDKITQCPNNTQSKAEPESEKVHTNLPDELLKYHTLDPYYVLTGNETCPISPGSTTSARQFSDFVDTSETVYMKKNISESARPKPQPITKYNETSSDIQAHRKDMGLGPETVNMSHIKVTDMPEIKCPSIPDPTESVTTIGEEVSLSELLRRVRERSRLAYTTKVGKCGGKAPRCAPTAPRSPPNNPVPPPTFGLPMLKRRPPVCPKRKPDNKCSYATNCPEHEVNEAEVCAVRSNVNLTEEVIDRLQNLGKILGGVLRYMKSSVETAVRDYEPWAPIPSWKYPPKVEKKEWQPGKSCVKGCPYSPKAVISMDKDPPSQNVKPCEGFPKRRSFSTLDCFPVSLGEKKVYDLGEF